MLVPENMDIIYLEAVSKSRLALQRPRGFLRPLLEGLQDGARV